MKKKNVVCILEGLGNQMFQYAFAKSLEIHTERNVYIDAESLRKKKIGDNLSSPTVREYKLDYFNISLKQVNETIRCLWNYTRGDKWYHEIIKMLNEYGIYPYKYFSQKNFKDISLMNPPFDKIEANTYIKGWFQTEEYFIDIREILLKEFQPKKSISIPSSILKAILDNKSVSIHIRRGDFKRGKLVLDKSYYEMARGEIYTRISKPVWIVFSDEISFVKENYDFKGEVIFIDESYKLKDYEQLILMSMCSHNIIANSTFSWWGAWLNQNENKYIIAPAKKWGINQKNIVPLDWIKI